MTEAAFSAPGGPLASARAGATIGFDPLSNGIEPERRRATVTLHPGRGASLIVDVRQADEGCGSNALERGAPTPAGVH